MSKGSLSHMMAVHPIPPCESHSMDLMISLLDGKRLYLKFGHYDVLLPFKANTEAARL